MSHQDLIKDIPSSFRIIAQSESTKAAAILDKDRKIYRLQFHPEVTHTRLGKKMFENFLYKICKCQPNWNIESYIKQSIEEIRNRVGK